MKLLTRTFRDFQRLLPSGLWFSCGIAILVIAVEMVGRQVANDLYDGLAGSVLALAVMLVVVRHRQTPLGWVQSLIRLGRRTWAFVRGFGFEIGIDLRGTPALPPGYPPPILLTMVLLAGWAVLAVSFAGAFPQGIRALLGQVFYLGYLVGLLGLWALLVGGLVIAIFVPTAMIHDMLVGWHREQRPRPRHLEFLFVGMYFVAIAAASVLLPPWAPFAVCGAALLVNLVTIALPANPDVQFIWRYRGSPTIRSVSWGRWVTCEFTLLTLIIIDLVLTSYGSVALTGNAAAREVMPVTTFLGLLLAWLAPGALCALVLQTILGRTRDPARPCPRTVYVKGDRLNEHREALVARFAERGWQVRFAPQAAGPTDVPIELVDPPQTVPEPESRWPLKLGVAALGSEDVMARLERRDEIQKRRRLLTGLEHLFKRAARRKYRQGSGFWVAPQYWFVVGLSRDTHEDLIDPQDGTILSGTIGPFYHRILLREVRNHIYQIMRALEIDLIFVEDGVGFRRFVRVMRMMFEIFDIHGGRRRADEMHFQGLPGVRVLIHDYQLSEPFKSDVYPEPDYENLGRARILHVFRDRGEHESPLETPTDFTHTPVPSLAY